MKKILLILLIGLFLTGCNAEYDLTIDSRTIKENITLIAQNDAENYNIANNGVFVESYINSPVDSENNAKIEGVEYYNILKNLNKNYYEMYLNYDFPFNKFIDANIVNNTVNNFNIDVNYNIFDFNIGNYFKVFDEYEELNNLVIKIKIEDEFQILDNNADSINNNTMFWNINRNNYTNKFINFKIQNVNEEEEEENKSFEEEQEEIIVNNNTNNVKDNTLIYALMIPLIFTLVLTVILILKKRG